MKSDSVAGTGWVIVTLWLVAILGLGWGSAVGTDDRCQQRMMASDACGVEGRSCPLLEERSPHSVCTSLRKIQQDCSLFSIRWNLGLKWLKNATNWVYLRRVTRWIFLHQIKWHLVHWSHIFFTLHFVAAFYTCSVSILYLWIRLSFALWKAE